jgi:hypothetical protein
LTSVVKRGFDPEDHKWFSKEAVERLKVAQVEIEWLLNRGYKIDVALDFVAGHYQFTARQRVALLRATATETQVQKRVIKSLQLPLAKEDGIYIDGFNLIINLEVALSGSILIIGRDGVIRDLAGLRGTYRLIDKTDKALELIGLTLKELQVPYVKFFLDAPVSNSGRLKSKILESAEGWEIPVEVNLVPNADPILSKLGRVVTGDSVILDECISWFNLLRFIVEDKVRDAWIIDFYSYK